MTAAGALQVYAGPRARALLRERGLRPQDLRAIPAAAGGAKGLVLNPLDRFLFSDWLPRSRQTVHLMGASIGAWRMAAGCLDDPQAALLRLADDYISQSYEHAPGRRPAASHISAVFGAKLGEHFAGRETEVLQHPRYRLHVFTSRGRHVLARQGRLRTPIGYAGAFFGNALHRRALGGWLERVIFGDAREAFPLPLSDFRSRTVPLSATNLQPAILASCSIPFWLDAVHDIPGGPRGAYWDGGITDYHLHLPYAHLADGIVLYPHFQPQVVPGWLDKPWKRRHVASAMLDNVVVLSPAPAWVATLPNAKLPARQDFKAYGDDHAGRQRAWRRAVAESTRLADDFAALAGRESLDALPLP
jgi:hypothetical protein